MQQTKLATIGTQIRYFKLVQTCLEELCGMSRQVALGAITDYLSRINEWTPNLPRQDRGVIYHDEPVNTAMSLAHEPPLDGYNPRTGEILAMYGPIRKRFWGV